MSPANKPITLMPVAPFVLELHSERMVDALLALSEAGFTVQYVRGTANRYRIDDSQELSK